MKSFIVVAVCCAARVIGLGIPNYGLPTTTFTTSPPWQYSGVTGISTGGGFRNVIPSTFQPALSQYRRTYDSQNDFIYVPLNDYVLLTPADLNQVAPRSAVLAVGPTVQQLDADDIGDIVAHPALTSDAFPSSASFDKLAPDVPLFLVPQVLAPDVTGNVVPYVVKQGQCYAWTGGSLDWNMFINSPLAQVFSAGWLASLDAQDQQLNGLPSFGGAGLLTTGINTLTSLNTYPQAFIESSVVGDGLYFCKEAALLGTVFDHDGSQGLSFKDRNVYDNYGGQRPNHYLRHGCDRQNHLNGGLSACFGAPNPF